MIMNAVMDAVLRGQHHAIYGPGKWCTPSGKTNAMLVYGSASRVKKYSISEERNCTSFVSQQETLPTCHL